MYCSFFLFFFFFAVLNPFRFSLHIFATNLFQVVIYSVPLNLLLLHVMWQGHEFNVLLNLVCQTIHFSSKYKRYIYVISNPPHLLKTTRNCLNIPGSRRVSFYVECWSSLDIEPCEWYCLEDHACGLQLLPKIKYGHCLLDPILCNKCQVSSTKVKYDC